MSIEAAVLGTAVKDAEPRTAASGKMWTSVILRSGDGDAAQFVQVAVFGDAAVALGRIERGERLYAEGSIRINEWTTATGEKRTGLSMAAWRAERPGIGRHRPKRDAKPEAPPLQPAQRPTPDSNSFYRPHGQQQRPPQPAREPEFWNDDPGF